MFVYILNKISLLIKKNINNPLFVILLFLPIFLIFFNIRISNIFNIGIEVSFIIILFHILVYFNKINKKNRILSVFKTKIEVYFIVLLFLILGWFDILGWFLNISKVKEIINNYDLIITILTFIYLVLHTIFLIFYPFLIITGKLNGINKE